MILSTALTTFELKFNAKKKKKKVKHVETFQKYSLIIFKLLQQYRQ